MKQVLIVGNWKSNKTNQQAQEWLDQFQISNHNIIICPPFTLLPQLDWRIKNQKLGIKLGAQDISPFDEGAYTGEINGKQIKEFCEYVIIGHSERRKYFSEDDSKLEKKVAMAKKYGIKVIFCVQGEHDVIPQGVEIVAYEPVFAIGTGTPDTPENANETAKKIKEIIDVPVLYGGSVTSQNVKNFTQMPHIDGVLVGGASLDAYEFASIIEKA
ncbi:MAG: triosephosphate isomerase [Candidatus Levybacteria bacterium]|nr:triosephosphate isomerase [Candidatus Levybacteria bacterium]